MLRTAFGGLIATSLLFAVVLIILWADSYRLYRAASYLYSIRSGADVIDRRYSFLLEPGTLLYCAAEYTHGDASPELLESAGKPAVWDFSSGSAGDVKQSDYLDSTYYHHLTDWRVSRFGIYDYAASGELMKIVSVPIWMPIALLLILPLARGRALWRRRQRLRAGLCVACGYDLRATTNLCPECGKPVTAVSSASTT